MKVLLEEAQYVCNIPPGNEVNALDRADTVERSTGPSSFKHQIHLQPFSTLPSNPNSQTFLVFRFFFPHHHKTCFYICYFQHRFRLIQKRGKFCPHHTFFFPPTPWLSLSLCSSVTPKSFGSTPGLAPALNIVQLHGSLRLS